MGVWAAAASCGCPTASFVKSSARDGPRRGAFRVLGSAGKVTSLYVVPADVPEPSTIVGTVLRVRRRRDGARTNFGEKNGRRPHEIWARRSGHFSMPATALHRSKSYLSRPVAPFNAAGRTLFGPTRVPHDGSRIPPARSCPPLCLKVLCEPVDSCFSLKLLNGFYTKPV